MIKPNAKTLANSLNGTIINFPLDIKTRFKGSASFIFERTDGLRKKFNSQKGLNIASRYFLGLKFSSGLEMNFNKFGNVFCGVTAELGLRTSSYFILKENIFFTGITEEFILFKIDNDGVKTLINSSLEAFGNINLIKYHQLLRYKKGFFNADVFLNCKSKIGLEQKFNITTIEKANAKINNAIINSNFFNNRIVNNILNFLGISISDLKLDLADDDSL